MTDYRQMNAQERALEITQLESRYAAIQKKGLKLNLTRGRPSAEQLNLSQGLLDVLGYDDYRAADGTDCRNYGGLEGIAELRQLFGEILGVDAGNVLVLGTSSLNQMYDCAIRCLLFGVPGGDGKPWSAERPVKFLCPSPGYDRHFAISELLGIEMIPIQMTPDGPDMDEVERLAGSDPSIKGIWCVPLYSNPDGICYSEDTCRRLASMPAAADFRIFWDNAYAIHHHDPDVPSTIPEMLSLCAASGHPDRVFLFASLAKVTWAGSSPSCLAASKANVDWVRKLMAIQTIGPDKMTQLRHVRFLRDKAGVLRLMARHAAILAPRFARVDEILSRELSGTAACRWEKPRGGYFFSLYVTPGAAAAAIRLAKEAGIEITPAGSAYPYGKDPWDSHIRLAPTLPPLDELEQAVETLAVSIRLAVLRLLESAATPTGTDR